MLRGLAVPFAGLMLVLLVMIGGGYFFAGSKMGVLAGRSMPLGPDPSYAPDAATDTPPAKLEEAQPAAPNASPNRPRFMGATKSGGAMLAEELQQAGPFFEDAEIVPAPTATDGGVAPAAQQAP